MRSGRMSIFTVRVQAGAGGGWNIGGERREEEKITRSKSESAMRNPPARWAVKDSCDYSGCAGIRGERLEGRGAGERRPVGVERLETSCVRRLLWLSLGA